MNSLYLRLKFEIEKFIVLLEGLFLLLFDFKVIIMMNGESFFEFYKKFVKKLFFVYY